jgi:formyl-CoA transferase
VPGVIPVLSATPGSIRTPAPKLGEHTDAVLSEVGYSAAEIAKLRESAIV